MIDVSAIILAHQEGVIAGQSLRSLLDAASHAENSGITTEIIAVLDRPDTATLEVFDCRDDVPVRTEIVDFGDQGLARNAGVECARGRYIAFLDGDDLWSYNWLAEAYRCAEADPKSIIVHPEFNWFFEGSQNLFVHADMECPLFDFEFLRISNYWDALCFCHAEIYKQFPYCKRDIAGGFAYEDWHWNCLTIERGLQHRIAKDTIHFKRRRADSQNVQTTRRQALVRPTELSSYLWYPSSKSTPS